MEFVDAVEGLAGVELVGIECQCRTVIPFAEAASGPLQLDPHVLVRRLAILLNRAANVLAIVGLQFFQLGVRNLNPELGDCPLFEEFVTGVRFASRWFGNSRRVGSLSQHQPCKHDQAGNETVHHRNSIWISCNAQSVLHESQALPPFRRVFLSLWILAVGG